jgi:hypothetical protein
MQQVTDFIQRPNQRGDYSPRINAGVLNPRRVDKELDRIGLDEFVDFCISFDMIGIKFWEIDYDRAPTKAYKGYDFEVLDKIRVMDEHTQLQEFWAAISGFKVAAKKNA